MFLLALITCSSQSRLAHLPGATRVTELANGELLVGTDTGQLWIVTSFGERVLLASVPGEKVAELVSDPLGRYWARTEGGQVYGGDAWSPETTLVGVASVLVRGCEDTRLLNSGEVVPGVSALSLAHDSCEILVAGTVDGEVGGHNVSRARIVRVQAMKDGVLWVDADTNAGCLGCALPMSSVGVVDALPLHLAPFVAGEIVWIDADGTLWITRG